MTWQQRVIHEGGDPFELNLLELHEDLPVELLEANESVVQVGLAVTITLGGLLHSPQSIPGILAGCKAFLLCGPILSKQGEEEEGWGFKVCRGDTQPATQAHHVLPECSEDDLILLLHVVSLRASSPAQAHGIRKTC